MKKRIALASLALALAGAGSLVGVHVAGASDGSASTQQHIVAVQNSEEEPLTIYAFGPITGVGTDSEQTDNTDVFTFPDGTLTIEHVARHSEPTFDPVTCEGHVRERGTWKVVAGTGAYADAGGSGTYVARAEMSGSCDENTPPTSFFAVIEADGRISL